MIKASFLSSRTYRFSDIIFDNKSTCFRCRSSDAVKRERIVLHVAYVRGQRNGDLYVIEILFDRSGRPPVGAEDQRIFDDRFNRAGYSTLNLD